MSAIAWPAIEKAIHDWVVASSGLPANRVIWADHGGPRPQAPLIAMNVLDTLSIGRDWRVYEDAPDPAPGAELAVFARGMRTATLELQCFGGESSGIGALDTLTTVIGAIPLYDAALDTAGAGIGTITAAKNIPGATRGTILEPRAVVEVTLHLGSEVEGRATYIERVQVTTHETTTGDVRELWIPDPPPP